MQSGEFGCCPVDAKSKPRLPPGIHGSLEHGSDLRCSLHHRLNLPRSARSFKFVHLNCCKYLPLSCDRDNRVWQCPNHQSDKDLEHQFSTVQLDASGCAMVTVPNCANDSTNSRSRLAYTLDAVSSRHFEVEEASKDREQPNLELLSC